MKPPKEITEARDAAIRKGHAQGKTQTEIAAALGVTPGAVSLRAKKMGLKFAKRLGAEQVEEARRLAQHMTLDNVAGVLGVSRYALYHHGVRSGFKKPLSHGVSGYAHRACPCQTCVAAGRARGREYYYRVAKWRRRAASSRKPLDSQTNHK